MSRVKTLAIHPSYARLAQAAQARGIIGEAALTIALKYADQQKVNNWQRRGVSKDGALDAERHIGCAAVWILDGTAVRIDSPTALQAQQPIPPYQPEAITRLLQAAHRLNDKALDAITTLAESLTK